MTNPLPRTLPKWTVVFLDDPNDRTLMTRHVLSAPLHILTPEMMEAVRRVIAWDMSRGGTHALWPEYMPIHEALVAAFAHVLVPPQETGKDAPKTLTERAMKFMEERDSMGHGSWHRDQYDLVRLLAEEVDALRAEVKEGRRDR